MKRLLILALLCVPALAQAQPLAVPMPIHGHPQLKAYTDASQFPTIAGHLNWAPGENPVLSRRRWRARHCRGHVGQFHARSRPSESDQMPALRGDHRADQLPVLGAVVQRAGASVCHARVSGRDPRSGLGCDRDHDAAGDDRRARRGADVGGHAGHRSDDAVAVSDVARLVESATHGVVSVRQRRHLDKELFATFYVLTDPAGAGERPRAVHQRANVAARDAPRRELGPEPRRDTARDGAVLPLVPLKPTKPSARSLRRVATAPTSAARDGGTARRLRHSSPSARRSSRKSRKRRTSRFTRCSTPT
jgi:hypothetical protein